MEYRNKSICGESETEKQNEKNQTYNVPDSKITDENKVKKRKP